MNLDLALKKYERLAILEPKSESAHFALGLLYDAKEDYVHATKSLQVALEISPKNAAFWFFDGTLMARFAHKTELAIRQWERAIDMDPLIFKKLSSFIPQDLDYPLKQKLDDTIKVFEKEADQVPQNPYLIACHSFSVGLCGSVETGLSMFKFIQGQLLSNPRGLYLYGLLFILSEQWNEAIRVLEKSSELDRNFSNVLYQLGRCYLKVEKTALALRVLDRLVNLDPRHGKGLQTLGEIHFRQGKFEQAMQVLRQVLSLDPNNPRVHYLIGRSQQQVYQLEAAVLAYKEALRQDPNLSEAHYHIGGALSQLGKWEEAIESFKEAIRINPKDSYAKYHLGLAYAQAGRHENAVGAFKEIIEVNPKDGYAQYNLGLAYEKMGELNPAIEAYRQAAILNPNESYARYHLALCYQRMGQYTLAMAELEEVLRENPQDAYAAYNLGSVYAYLGFPDRALEAYARASELNPNDLYAHFNIGAILARDGLVEEANDAFKKALELSPHNDGELALYSTLASQMAVNIEIAKLNTKLKESYFDTVKAIVGCLDARDQYTAGHTNRVSVIATEIGKTLELSREDMDTLAVAAVLHDIGKVGVPDAILSKQGKLTPEEFLIMKEHPVKGAKILEQIRFPWKRVVDYVKHHHERFDGTGYPDQLKGEEIPIGARILSLADFFDALATERPYKKAYPISVVVEQAELQVNKAFDPDVVKALKKITLKFESLYKPAEALEGVPTWESSLVDSA